MKFCIENVSKSSGRLGQLIIADTGKPLKTPLLLQTTKGGSIPHLSREVFDYVTNEPQILQLSIATMLRMAESASKFKGAGGLSEYIGYKNFPTLLTLYDPCESLQGGYNDKDIVPIFTRHGKEQLSASRYMDLVECLNPDIYEGLCDADTNRSSAKKRVQKSLDRTENFMNYCFERHCNSEVLKKRTLFAPIVGGYSTHARSKSIQHTNKVGATNFGGYLLEGFHNYGLSALDVEEVELYNIVTYCLKELLQEKPRMMPGAYSPVVTLELIRLGVDMFDTSYPYCATKYFKALTFKFVPNSESTEEVQLGSYLDLTDESYKEDFKPFIDGCNCLTCRKHTRAYVHHLYKTKELLGPILLMIHNLHHYLQFFETIRACIAEDKLADLVKLIKYQNTEHEVNYNVRGCTKISPVIQEKDKEAESISL